MESVELRTHTRLWQVEKRLYKIYDYTLPAPISLRTVGVFLGVAVPWVLICKTIHLPFHAPGNIVWIAPPFIVTWLANQPVTEGKKLTEFLRSQFGYWIEQPHTLCRFRPFKQERVHVWAQTWKPKLKTADNTSSTTTPE